MRKPRTKKELLADPRVQQIEPSGFYTTESEILWQEYDGYGEDHNSHLPSYWLVLAKGWNCEGTSSLHCKTIKELCERLDQLVTKGDPC